jgi:hypothetical protein
VIHAFPCGAVALDFVGTRQPAAVTRRREAAPTVRSRCWFTESGMLDATPRTSQAELGAEIELREAM